MDDEPDYIHRRIWVRSAPGHYAQYDGHVDVWMVATDTDYLGAAVKELAHTAFPDRKLRDFWLFERQEALT